MTTSATPGKTDVSSAVRSNPVWRWRFSVVMIAVSVFFLFPLVYMVASSFKPDDKVLTGSQEVSAFLPTRAPMLFRYANLRNHRKILVVDGKIDSYWPRVNGW